MEKIKISVSNQMEKQRYGLGEAATCLDKTVLELVREVQRQQLPVVKEENRCWFRDDDIMNYLIQREKPAEPDKRFELPPPSPTTQPASLPGYPPVLPPVPEVAVVAAEPVLAAPRAERFEHLGMDHLLAQRMEQEGYNPSYVWAIVVKGFKLGTGFPRIGEQYQNVQHWENNIDHALRSLGLSPDKRELREQCRKLDYLFQYKKMGECVSLAPHWASMARGTIREYLLQLMPPRKVHNGR